MYGVGREGFKALLVAGRICGVSGGLVRLADRLVGIGEGMLLAGDVWGLFYL